MEQHKLPNSDLRKLMAKATVTAIISALTAAPDFRVYESQAEKPTTDGPGDRPGLTEKPYLDTQCWRRERDSTQGELLSNPILIYKSNDNFLTTDFLGIHYGF